MTIGQRGGHYTEADDSNMQIEQVGHEFFLDKWVGDGWKNISVHKSYDDALKAREELAASKRRGKAWSKHEGDQCNRG